MGEPVAMEEIGTSFGRRGGALREVGPEDFDSWDGSTMERAWT